MKKTKRRGRPLKDLRYPNLQRWLEEMNATLTDLARWCEVLPDTMRYGMKSGNPHKYLIDRVLKVTGMKYEDAFWEE